MNSNNIVLICALFVLYFSQVEGSKQCMGKNMNYGDDFKKAITTCYGKYKIEQGKKPPACFMPCLYNEVGCVKDGKFGLEEYKTFVANKYPSEAQSKITEGAQKCITDSSANALSMDDDCKSWTSLIICLHKNHVDSCKGSASEDEMEE